MKRQDWIVAMLLSFAVAIPLRSQWIQTNGPYGGKTTAILASDPYIFATNSSNMFRSTNSGFNWTQVTTDMPVSSFAKVGSVLFAGTNGRGIFRSIDNGTTWTAVNAGLTSSYIRILAARDTNLFAGTDGGGVFRYGSSGNWIAVNNGLTISANCRVYELRFSGTILFAATNNGLFRSLNNGGNWGEVKSGLPNLSNNIDYSIHLCFADSIMIGGVSGNGIYRSTDNGLNWIRVDSSETMRHVGAIFMHDGVLLAGSCRIGLFRSTDYGATWIQTGSGLPQPYIDCYCEAGEYLFEGDEFAGIFRSSDSGTSWIQTNQGMSLEVSCVAVNGTHLYAGTLGGGLFLTTDNGANWSALTYSGGSGFINGLVVNNSTIFISNGGSSGGGAGTAHGPDGSVYRSTDNGQSWSNINSNLSNTNAWALAIHGPYLFTGTQGGGVFRSSNNGESWTQVRNGLTTDTVWSVAANDSDIFAGTQDGLFTSTNFGDYWTKIDIRVLSGWTFKVVNALAVKGDTLSACTDQGAYFSVDNGKSWTLMPGATKMYILSLAATSNFVFAGTSRSVWRMPMSMLTDVAVSRPLLPSNHELDQNYPNPFNPCTTIRFELQKDGYVSLKIFNMLGQLVATLVDEPKRAGAYQVKWDASNAPSGTYFYRLQTAGFVVTRKMIVIK